MGNVRIASIDGQYGAYLTTEGMNNDFKVLNQVKIVLISRKNVDSLLTQELG